METVDGMPLMIIAGAIYGAHTMVIVALISMTLVIPVTDNVEETPVLVGVIPYVHLMVIAALITGVNVLISKENKSIEKPSKKPKMMPENTDKIIELYCVYIMKLFDIS